jgi:hypothetical protein
MLPRNGEICRRVKAFDVFPRRNWLKAKRKNNALSEISAGIVVNLLWFRKKQNIIGSRRE